MDCQSPLECDPSKISLLRFCCVLLPPSEYNMYLTQFPGTNCHPPYGLGGEFYVDMRVYDRGKLVGTISTSHCTEKGLLNVDLQDMTQYYEPSGYGVLVTDFYHPSDIPVELYFRNIHKKTGSYLAYPSLPFIGDEIYAAWHSEMLENTIFWPGVICSDTTETGLFVANPYDMPYSYQVSLYLGAERVAQTKVFKVSARSAKSHSVEELFPEHLEQVRNSNGQASLCVTGQYKVIAYVTIRDKKSGVITTVDHLHGYLFI